MTSVAELLRAAVQTTQIIRFTSVAAGTMIVLDHLVTLDQEIELIWRSPNRSGKWLFIVNRYYGLTAVLINNYGAFVNLSWTFWANINAIPRSPVYSQYDRISHHWLRWQGSSAIIFYVIAEVILQLRLFALYDTDRRVVAFIVLSSILAATASMTLMGIAIRDLSGYVAVLGDLPFCVPTNIPKYFYVFWIPILVLDTLLCGLAVFRGFRNPKFKPSLHYSRNEMLDVLLRDSVAHFIVLFTTYAVNMVLLLTEPKTLIEAPTVFAAAMSCIMGNRLLLNIRQTARDRDDVMLWSLETERRSMSLKAVVESMEMDEMGSRVSL